MCKKKKQGLQLVFTPEGAQKVEELRDRSGSPSDVEVVRKALKLHEWLLDQLEAGYKVNLVKENTIREIDFIF